MIQTKVAILILIFLVSALVFSTVALGQEVADPVSPDSGAILLEEGQFQIDCDTLVPVQEQDRLAHAGQKIMLVYKMVLDAPPSFDQYDVKGEDFCVGAVDPGTPPNDPPFYRQTLPRTGISIALMIALGAIGIGSARYLLKTGKQ